MIVADQLASANYVANYGRTKNFEGNDPQISAHRFFTLENMGRTIRGVKKEREAERKRRSDRQFTSDKTEAEYEIEKIVDSKSVAGGGTLYFVKWKV